MSDWTDRLAGELGVEALAPADETRLLDASRDIAHRVQRKDTPLSTYLLGVAVGSAIAAGRSPEDALAGALGQLTEALPEPPPATP